LASHSNYVNLLILNIIFTEDVSLLFFFFLFLYRLANTFTASVISVLISVYFFVVGISSELMNSVYARIEGSHVYTSLLILNLSNNSLVLFPSTLSRIPALKKIILVGNSLGSDSTGKNCW
jgi:hypothetical protein